MKRILGICVVLLILSWSAFGQPNPDQSRKDGPTEEKIAKYKRLWELLRHPTFISLRLASMRRDNSNESPSNTPSPYLVGEMLHFQSFITQTLGDTIQVIGDRSPYYAYRPQLIRDGDVVPYTKHAQKRIEVAEDASSGYSNAPATLESGREQRSNVVSLEDWYEVPIKQGHYQLTIKRRFTGDGDWIESNPVTFDVVSLKPENLIPLTAATTAQSDSDSDLDRLDRKLTAYLVRKMPGWQHKRGTLIQGSKDVIAEFWSIPNRIVKVSMMERKSVEEARENLAHFAREEPGAQELKGVGDEAYAWGFAGSNIVFRCSKYTIYVATTADVERDADASSLTPEQKGARTASEMKRLSKEVARHAADALEVLPVTFNAVTNSQPQVPQIPKSTPNYLGTSIPDPPQQNSPWTEPRIHLPVNLISATARLFEQGLADPRGMEYREIKLVMGSYWHGGIILPTHGWILPGTTDSQRFAVGWNGLVYPLVSIGGEADIRADVEAAIRADEEVRTKRSNADSSPFYRFRGATPEGSSLSATSLLPLKVCMLLRLGNVELAERVWAAWIAGMNAQINDDSLHLADPYLMLARDWTWAMFDRAVNAQMRGDDRMCWISATKAAAIEKSIRQEIPQRPILRAHQSSQYYLDFLKPLPSVIEDQERRVKYPHLPVPRDTTTLRQQTIAQLIDYLDEAFAIQTSIPGGVDMSQDAVVEELIRRGKAAVEPLLNALEKDTRLTRSVESSRPWHYDRHFITVYETALQALRRVLSVGNEDFEDWETVEKGAEGRKTVAARLKKLAQQKGYLSLNLPPPF